MLHSTLILLMTHLTTVIRYKYLSIYTQSPFSCNKVKHPILIWKFFSAVQSFLGLTMLHLSVSPLRPWIQRKVHTASYHTSDFQLISGSTQTPNLIRRQGKRQFKNSGVCPMQNMFKPCLSNGGETP